MSEREKSVELSVFWDRLSQEARDYISQAIAWLKPQPNTVAESMKKRGTTPLQMYWRLIAAPYEFEPLPGKTPPRRDAEPWMNLSYDEMVTNNLKDPGK